jgi:phenylacetate-CoA ligase
MQTAPPPWALASSLPGVLWPTLPQPAGTQILALQYQFEQSQWWPAAVLQARQLRQFAAVFRHAVDTVPYYRERYAPWMSGIADWTQYRELPVSTRREVQEAGESMHSNAPPPAHGPVMTTESSGSTGSPLVTRGTAWTQLLWHALLLRDHIWHRRDFGGKLVAIRNRATPARLADWGPATAAFRTGPSVVRTVSADLDEQLHWLAAEDPDYLLSLATNIHALAQRSLEIRLRLPRLKQVRTFAEMLRPDTRRLVREAWGVTVADSYSSEELGYIALQCPDTEGYHVQCESLIVEVLDEAGRPCEPGETGQVVVSTLHNFAMPLLRYASGDYAEAGAPCACGRGLPLLRRIVGRQRNMLFSPDGRRYWPSFASEVWRPIAPILQFQVIQNTRDDIEFNFVCSRGLTADEHRALVAALNGSLGFDYRVTLRRLDAIPRPKGGKYEDFICRVGQDGSQAA